MSYPQGRVCVCFYIDIDIDRLNEKVNSTWNNIHFAFDTDLTALLFIAIIWFINNLSYLLCAARLERRK